MADDRLVGRTKELATILQAGIDKVIALRPLTWERYHSLLEFDGSAMTLRQLACRASLGFGAIVRVRVLDRVEGPPYNLLDGSLNDNVAALALDDDPPDDIVTKKVWGLAQLNRQKRAHEGVLLFPQLGHSSKVAEEAHIGISLNRKSHKGYHLRTLLLRAFLYNCRQFIPPDFKTEKSKVEGKLKALTRKQPQKTSAYNMHIAVQTERAYKGRRFKEPSFEEQHNIVKKAAAAWQQQDIGPNNTRLCEELKARHIKRARKSIDSKCEELESKFYDIAQRERKFLRSAGEQGSVAGCRWSVEFMRDLDDIYSSANYSWARVQEFVKECMKRPEGISEAREAELAEFVQPQFDCRRLSDEMFNWVRIFCRHRDHLHGSILTFECAEGRHSYLLANTKQRPYTCTFIQLLPEPEHIRSANNVTDLVRTMGRGHLQAFTVIPGSGLLEEDLPVTGGELRFVTEAAVVGRERHVYIDLEAEPWAVWEARLPPMPAKDRHEGDDKPNRRRARVGVDGWEQMRREADRKAKLKAKALEGHSSDSSSRSSDSDIEKTAERRRGLMTDQIRKYMDKYREEDLEWHPLGLGNFHVEPRGAPSNVRRKGVIFDSYRASACTDDGKEFLEHYGIAQSFSAEFAAHRGRFQAGVLCRAWAGKMEHLCSLWAPTRPAPYDFTPEDILSWEQPKEFTDLQNLGDLPRETARRCEHILNLVPKAWVPL